jgi:HlyD family secretion protein
VQLRLKTLEIERDAALAVLEARWQEFSEMMSGYRPEEVEQVRARLAAARVQETWARNRLDRATRGGLASRPEDVDEARATLDNALHNVAMTQATYAIAIEGPRYEHKLRTRALVDAAHEEVQRIEDELWKKTLRAPFDGYVSAEHTEVGQWLQDRDPAVEIIELKELEVEVKVPERHLSAVAEGQAVKVEIEALKAIGKTALPGTIIHVVPQVDPQSRTLPVKVKLANRIDENNRPWINAGMLVQVKVPVGRQRSLLVPKDALVLNTGRDPVVYVVTPDGEKTVARPVSVRTGNAHESLMEVQGELKPGMNVIVRGNERVRPGQEIIVQK